MKAVWRLITFTGELWRLYVGIAVMSVVIALLNQATPLLLKQIIDILTTAGAQYETELPRIATLVALIFVADAGVTFISNFNGYWGDILTVKLKKLLSERYFAHLLKLPQTYFDNELTGVITNRLTRTVETIGGFMQMWANNFVQFLLSTVLTLGIIAFYSWEVSLMLFMLYPAFLWLTQRTSNNWQVYQQKINEDVDTAHGRFQEVVAQVRVVKSYIQENLETRFFDQRFQRVLGYTRDQSLQWHRHDIERRLLLNVIFLAVYAYVVYQTFRGRLTLGELVLLLSYATYIRIPLFSMSFIVDNTQKALSGSRDYFAVMDLPVLEEPKGTKRLKLRGGEVAFQNVSFSYEGGDKVLKNLTFTIPPGKKLALIGQSGEGKSTVANLLLRLYEPAGGTITIDGQIISEISLRSLRQIVAVVFQDTALFSGTVRENIYYGRPAATKAEVIAAAKAANAHQFIMKLPKGYDTLVGERGVKLSGGQRQRVAIARALLKDAPILILDEATSSLDSKAESEVQEALEKLMEGKTTLIIAHRFSTIRNADLIVSLKGGRITEIGSPSELAGQGGIYAELLKLQDPHYRKQHKKKLKSYELVG